MDKAQQQHQQQRLHTHSGCGSRGSDITFPAGENTNEEFRNEEFTDDEEVNAAFLILNLFYADVGQEKSVAEILGIVRRARRASRDWLQELDLRIQNKYAVSPGLVKGFRAQIMRLR